MRRFCITLLIAFLALIPLLPGESSADSALWPHVQAAYRQYLERVEAGAATESVQEALERYRGLYERYLDGLAGLEAPSGENSLLRVSAAASVPAAGEAKSAVTRRLSSTLYAQKSRLDVLVSRLEAALAAGPEPETACRLRLELAFLQMEFRQDMDRACRLLEEIRAEVKAGRVTGELARQSEEVGRRFNARRHVSQLSSTILVKKQQAYEAQKQFQSLSFFRQPVGKTLAYFRLVKERAKYRLDVAKMREFHYENQANGTYAIDQTGLSFLVDIQRFDFGVQDIFQAIRVDEAAEQVEARLISDNMDAWCTRWQIVSRAQRSIDITYFILEPDIFGMSLLGLLYERAQAGVQIRLMVDAKGTKALAKSFMGQDYLQELVALPNVQVKIFNPMHRAIPRIWQDLRTLIGANHDKIIVVDGETAITGGRNVSLNYFADPRDNETVFRDTDVVLRSPAIAGSMRLAFSEEFDGLYNQQVTADLFGNWRSRVATLDWARRAMERWLHGDALPAPDAPDTEELHAELSSYRHLQGRYRSYDALAGRVLAGVKILDKHSFNTERNDITDNLLRFMDACREEIVIQNPYVILTDAIFAALKRAAARGVKIIFQTNSPVSTDSILTQAFFMNDWKRVLTELPGSRIFVFAGKNKLHAKVFVFDRKISVIGTYNMDSMSEQINSEVVAVLDSQEFARILRNNIQGDIDISDEYKVALRPDGGVEVLRGPGDITPKKTMIILDLLRKFKILKPLI